MIQIIGNITLFIMGWALFVAGQAQNSIRSKTNGLPEGFAGLHQWLSFHVVNLCQRAFFSGLFYGFIVHSVAVKLQAVGFPVTASFCAGFGGFAANGMLYQLFGMIPGLRTEVADLSPPPNAQVVSTSPTSPTTSNGSHHTGA